MRGQRWRGVVLASVLAVVAGGVANIGGRAAAQTGCGLRDDSAAAGGVRSVPPDGTGRGFPIVTIHGINSDADVWKDAVGSGASTPTLTGIEGAHVYSFSYRDDSLSWVDGDDDDPIVQRFGEAIDCLEREHGLPVSIVAHSRGGLIARKVANIAGGDKMSRVAKLGKVVTLGTPYAGSDLAALALAVEAHGIDGFIGSPTGLIGLALITACGLAASNWGRDPCLLVGLLNSEAGRALAAGSESIRRLKPWPAEVDTTAIAGSTTATLPLFFARSAPVDMGDLVVSTASATADARSQRRGECALDVPVLGGPVGVVGLAGRVRATACFHVVLPGSPTFLGLAVEELRSWIDRVRSPGTVGGVTLLGYRELPTDRFAEIRTALDDSGVAAASGLGDDVSCYSLEISGWAPGGNVDVYVGYGASSATSCGGDSLSSFHAIRDGKEVLSLTACGDCDFGPDVERDQFDEVTNLLRGRPTITATLSNVASGWQIDSVERSTST